MNISNDFLLPDEIYRQISRGDTVTIGLDYYAMTGISRRMVPSQLRKVFFETVVVFNVFVKDSLIIWEPKG